MSSNVHNRLKFAKIVYGNAKKKKNETKMEHSRMMYMKHLNELTL